MLLVIPVSHVDLDDAARMLRRICDYGDMKEEHLIIVATWQASWKIDNFVKYAEKHFATVTLHKATTENEMGWPESCNHLFYEAAGAIDKMAIGWPYYYMEGDCVALRPGWFQAFKAEYVESGKSYMGVVNKSRWVDLATKKETVRGKHMVGTGIYPADFFTRSELVHSLDVVPWDVAIQDEVMEDCHDTKLIAHRWGTKNYRLTDEGIMMDPIDLEKTNYAALIPAGTLVVHGCKDGSLDNLLRTSEPAALMRSL